MLEIEITRPHASAILGVTCDPSDGPGVRLSALAEGQVAAKAGSLFVGDTIDDRASSSSICSALSPAERPPASTTLAPGVVASEPRSRNPALFVPVRELGSR